MSIGRLALALLAALALAGCSAPAAEVPATVHEDRQLDTDETISGAEWCKTAWQGDETWPAGPLLTMIMSRTEHSQSVEDYVAMDDVIDELFGRELQSTDGPDPQLVRDIYVWYRQTYYVLPDTTGENIGPEAAKVGLADVYNQCMEVVDLPELGLGDDKTHAQEFLYMALHLSGRLDQTGEVSQCELDFRRAAEVPAGHSNDEVLSSTLTSCSSVEHWKDTLREHPSVLGVASLSDAEVDLSFEVLCANWGTGAPLCERGE